MKSKNVCKKLTLNSLTVEVKVMLSELTKCLVNLRNTLLRETP